MGMNKEDEELVKMVNPTLKRRETILLFLIVVINGLKCIVSDIGLDTCAINRLIQTQSKIQQLNKCRMTSTTSAQSVQAQNSTRKNTLLCQEPLYFFFLGILQ